MPVAAKIRRPLGNDDQVPLPDPDPALTTRAQVALPGRIGLDRRDDLYPERAAHSTSATATKTVPITIATSTRSRRWGRKGLKPIAGMVGATGGA